MNYFICQEWLNTKGNHAGMVNMCKLIKSNYPNENKIIVVSDYKLYYNRYLAFINIVTFLNFFLGIYLFLVTKKNDKIFLVEYFLKSRNQLIIANILKLKHLKIFGFAHLTPKYFDLQFTEKELHSWISSIDTIITFGNTLTEYFNSKKCKKKIITSLHYVDKNFYHRSKPLFVNSLPEIICMGNQARNYDLLYEIITLLPNHHFHLCLGTAKNLKLFESLKNVQIYGYLPENDLKSLMELCDISLNVMDDTVGSNVITTSMSIGLAMIASDVGSIRDYCNEKNCIFCSDSSSFVSAIIKTTINKDLIMSMKEESLKLSHHFSIENLYLKIN